MTQSVISLARNFSLGKFDEVFDFFDDGIEWFIPGQGTFEGRKEVVDQCLKNSVYFKSVETDFRICDVLQFNNHIVITGTAEFSRDGQRIAFVNACDIYLFGDEGVLKKISSYCVVE